MFEKLCEALNGNSDALKEYGIDLSQAGIFDAEGYGALSPDEQLKRILGYIVSRDRLNPDYGSGMDWFNSTLEGLPEWMTRESEIREALNLRQQELDDEEKPFYDQLEALEAMSGKGVSHKNQAVWNAGRSKLIAYFADAGQYIDEEGNIDSEGIRAAYSAWKEQAIDAAEREMSGIIYQLFDETEKTNSMLLNELEVAEQRGKNAYSDLDELIGSNGLVLVKSGDYISDRGTLVSSMEEEGKWIYIMTEKNANVVNEGLLAQGVSEKELQKKARLCSLWRLIQRRCCVTCRATLNSSAARRI